MKKLFFCANAFQRSVFCMVLLLSTCLVGFTSCGDDDDEEENGEIEIGTGIVGTWQSVKVESWEYDDYDGYREYNGPYDAYFVTFTSDGKFTQFDDEEEDSGTYKLVENKIIVTGEEDGVVETFEAKVLYLSGKKMILESETDEVCDGIVFKDYMKMELKKIK